ncbi:hypothetical protein HN911_00810 [Candidatus Bathyarchaeota archaeon]|jgi:hypothetical protein|nr:hypothetical protein [Candidatus Bathyarchaeota archaeon]MBT7914478.1 hypothetical protein [Candidatus Bathyarchaeota archaeon]
MATPAEVQATAELFSSAKTLLAAVGGTGIGSALVTLGVIKFLGISKNGKATGDTVCAAAPALMELTEKMEQMVNAQNTGNKLLELLVQKEMQGG